MNKYKIDRERERGRQVRDSQRMRRMREEQRAEDKERGEEVGEEKTAKGTQDSLWSAAHINKIKPVL